MNYRHAFHAGNFADLLKHAAVTLVMDRLAVEPGPVLVLDSHAGAGAYDLEGEMARKSGEAQAGVVQLMADGQAPQAFRRLQAAVRKANPDGALRVYPGSPALIADRLRPGDEYLGAELRPDDFATLAETLAVSRGRARAVRSDGFAMVEASSGDRRRLFVLIDPPFEDPGDYDRIVETMAVVLRRPAPAWVMIWLPLKDLETFDSFLRRLELLEPPAALVVEARLRPLADPMKMNGCALVCLGLPSDLEAPLAEAAHWVATRTGDPGSSAKVWRLG